MGKPAKRSRDAPETTAAAASSAAAPDQPEDEPHFEDPYDDEFAPEEEAEEEEGEEGEEGGEAGGAEGAPTPGAPGVWRVGMPLGADEELDFDPSAYVMYHALSAEWPCLSFDVLPDRLGGGRSKFPLSASLVSGTQADTPSNNLLLVMRVTQLNKTQVGEEDESSDGDSDADSTDDDPLLDVVRCPHPGGVNRVRVMPQEPHMVATWSDAGVVSLWDVRPQIALLDAGEGKGKAAPLPRGYGPVKSFKGHGVEGYAVDWSPVAPGRLVTGDCNGGIHVWDCAVEAAVSALKGEGGPEAVSSLWSVAGGAGYVGHKKSVEDLQWSPNEGGVFASASADGSVRIWDARTRSKAQLSVTASATDVNVISWSRLVTYLLASGHDDGSFSVWDLRSFKAEAPVAHFGWHSGQVTSIEWAPDDENELLVASADNTVTLWDLSLEEDDEAEAALTAAGGGAGALPSSKDPAMKGIPPQILFVHAGALGVGRVGRCSRRVGVLCVSDPTPGQREVKEAHFHRQLPGVIISTAADGFNLCAWAARVFLTPFPRVAPRSTLPPLPLFLQSSPPWSWSLEWGAKCCGLQIKSLKSIWPPPQPHATPIATSPASSNAPPPTTAPLAPLVSPPPVPHGPATDPVVQSGGQPRTRTL